MRFWLSWDDESEDYRPLTYPPNKAILGWWCSGYGDNFSTICALVEANDEKAAWKAVRQDWPEATTERFCSERAADWTPNDRFPLSDWMKPRIGIKND